MEIYNDKSVATISDFPDTSWSGEAKYVVDDNSELGKKILSLAPFFEVIEDEDGNIVDVTEMEKS